MRLREEVIRLYDESGGLEVLQKITNIGHNTIKLWHKQFYENPERFYVVKGRKPRISKCTKNSFVSKILQKDNVREEEEEEEVEDQKDVTYSEITRNLPEDAIVEIKKVGELLLDKNSKGIGIDDEVRTQIVHLVELADDVSPIATLLGIDERLINSWVQFFSSQ